MNAIDQYRNTVLTVLQKAFDTQSEALEQGARLLAEATCSGHAIFTFGCNHAALPMLELYYRTGGLVTVNPVRAPGMCLDINPATMTSQMERMQGYGSIIADAQPIGRGDVLIVHSVSGRNPVPVDMALGAKRKGASIIVLTSLSTTDSVASRHRDGIKLRDTADVLIDNCGCVGDAAIKLPGVPDAVGPTSTAVAVALMNAMITRAIELTAETGAVPPVFVSANLDGGDAHNAQVMQTYKKQIHYM